MAQWFRRRCLLKIHFLYFLSVALAAFFVKWSGNISAILVEGMKRNNSVK